MKNTTAKIIITLLLFSSAAKAQKNIFSISAGPTVGIGVNRKFSMPVGASFKAMYGTGKLGSVISEITILSLKPKATTIGAAKTSLFIAKLNYRTYVNPITHFFVQADAGIAHYTFSNNINKYTKFFGGFGAGYAFVLNSKSSIDLLTNINYSQNVSISRIWPLANLSYRINLNAPKNKQN